MILKRWKLVYIVASVKILVATWNTSDQCEEDDLEMYDAKYFFKQDSVVPEHSKLESSENEMSSRGTYNDPVMRESYETETPRFQHSSTIPEYAELQQPHETEIFDYDTYNDPMMIWPSNDIKIRTGDELEERMDQGEVENPTIEHLMMEIRQTEQNSSSGVQLLEGEYSRRIAEIINEQEAVELDTSIEQLVTEIRQTEQNLSSGVQLLEGEYSRRIAEIIDEQEAVELNSLADNSEEMPIYESIDEQEAVELNSLVDNSEEMPIQESIDEHIPKQFHSSAVPQPAEDPSYEYSNSTFLFNFLHFPSPLITAGSIRVRFGAHFLSFLSSSQLIRVLIALLENKLELSNEDQKEFIETIFGHIDYSLELVITKDQVVVLVEAMMKSNVPDYFEQVYLTWKMWYSFTMEEQELMLKDVKREYKRETRMMLYLFVVNRDGNNSRQCEIFKNEIKSQYKKSRFCDVEYPLEKFVTERKNHHVKVFFIILNTFDTCLLDIPRVFKSLDNNAIIAFRDFFRNSFFIQDIRYSSDILKYKIHVCYAFTKFTPEFEQTNDGETNSRLYFNPEYSKAEFLNCMKMLKDNNILNKKVSAVKREENFVNAFAFIRQIVQSNEYNANMLYKILNKMDCNLDDKRYLILLLSLTNERILREFKENKEWSQQIKKRLKLTGKYNFMGCICINNAPFGLIFDSKYYSKDGTKDCVVRIHGVLSILDEKKRVKMHREHYFYRRLLLHPKLNVFKDEHMPDYIQGLNKIGRLNSKEQCDQLARDLIFNEYYRKGALEFLRPSEKPIKDEKLLEFKKCIERQNEIYKKNGDVEKEIELLRTY
ncbi:hypothetical protein PAEPH01_0343 [Pancytospora epiphaga]|nr:hypothetical protein PAEPH01_0343 [Pancytospora epiphaga]